MNFFHHKDLGNHLLQLCPKVVKHSREKRETGTSQQVAQLHDRYMIIIIITIIKNIFTFRNRDFVKKNFLVNKFLDFFMYCKESMYIVTEDKQENCSADQFE